MIDVLPGCWSLEAALMSLKDEIDDGNENLIDKCSSNKALIIIIDDKNRSNTVQQLLTSTYAGFAITLSYHHHCANTVTDIPIYF